MLSRMLRALKLDVHLFEEVEADKKATLQAMLVVVLSSLALGIGMTLERGVVAGLIRGTLVGLATWAIWAYLNYLLGAKVFKEPQTSANWGQLLRTMGFAYTPGTIRILAIIPVPLIQGLALLAASIWTWVAMVIAVRQALDYKSTLRAVGVTLLGSVITALIVVLVFR